MRGLLSALVGVALAAGAAAAAPSWERDAEGECVRVWTASELLRGPVAMANGLVLPFRAFAGGLKGGGALGVVLSPAAFFAGIPEGAGLLLAGLTDLFTGGAFAVAPDGMAQLQFGLLPLLPEERRSDGGYWDGPSCQQEPLGRERRYPIEPGELPMPAEAGALDG